MQLLCVSCGLSAEPLAHRCHSASARAAPQATGPGSQRGAARCVPCSCCLLFINSSRSRLLIAPDSCSSKISSDCNLHRCCRRTNEPPAHLKLSKSQQAGTAPACHRGQPRADTSQRTVRPRVHRNLEHPARSGSAGRNPTLMPNWQRPACGTTPLACTSRCRGAQSTHGSAAAPSRAPSSAPRPCDMLAGCRGTRAPLSAKPRVLSRVEQCWK